MHIHSDEFAWSIVPKRLCVGHRIAWSRWTTKDDKTPGYMHLIIVMVGDRHEQVGPYFLQVCEACIQRHLRR